MPKYNQRLGWTSTIPEEPDFEVSSERWSELEKAYGRHLPDDAKLDLRQRCIRYFYNHRVEKSAAREKDVMSYAKRVSDDLQPLIEFAYGSFGRYLADSSTPDDAWREFEDRLTELLPEAAFSINLKSFSVCRTDGNNEEFIDSDDLQLRLSSSFVMEFAIRMDAILRHIQSGAPKDAGSGFIEGEAFRVFLRSVRNWAKNHSLPRAPFSSGRRDAGPLACLIFELNRDFPDEFRKSQLLTPKAAAVQIERAEKGRPRPLDQ